LTNVETERALLERLERIDSLRAANAPPGVLLAEIRSLLEEAEEWAREPSVPKRARAAIERSREAFETGEIRTESLAASR
jgi:hypothetical protein